MNAFPPAARRPHPVPLLLAAALLASCAAPSRQLTTRVVEDPITLPRRMASVSATVGGIPVEPDGTAAPFLPLPDFHTAGGVRDQQTGTGRLFLPLPDLRMGLTDRLEWTNFGSFTYAFLDDSPSSARHDRLSLAVRAGLLGLGGGISSESGLLLNPVLAVGARKRIADRWSLRLGLSDLVQWTQRDVPATASLHRLSVLVVAASVVRQLSPAVAAAIGGSLFQNHDCIDLTCAWSVRGGSAQASILYRPRLWLTVHLAADVASYGRPPVMTVQDPTEPIVPPPSPTTIVVGSVGASFYW